MTAHVAGGNDLFSRDSSMYCFDKLLLPFKVDKLPTPLLTLAGIRSYLLS
ncbi:hypothetical protein [Pontibacter sp. CAU 1760]